nr:WXG100 family type VII secretion target [Anaerolineae bacterium]
MPASMIKADYNQLTDIAKQFGGESDQLNAMVNAIKQGLDPLQGGDWQGVGAELFYAEMNNEVLPALQRLAKAMSAAQNTCNKILGMMQRAEDDASMLIVETVRKGEAGPQADNLGGGGGNGASGGGGGNGASGGGGSGFNNNGSPNFSPPAYNGQRGAGGLDTASLDRLANQLGHDSNGSLNDFANSDFSKGVDDFMKSLDQFRDGFGNDAGGGCLLYTS